MIAEAVKLARPDAVKIAVDLATIRFSDPKKGYRYVYLTPRIAQVSLLRFDEGIMPNAFRFSLSGGHVIAMARNRAKRISLTDEARDKAKISLAKARLVMRGGANHGSTERVGGKPAPSMSHANRRAFGPRGLGRAPELMGVPAEMLGNDNNP